MIKKPIYLILSVLFCFILSCKKNPVSPTPDPTKPEETTIDRNLLTGWWVPVEKGKAKIYFGTDNFFYLDTTLVKSPYKVNEPIPGFWRLSGQNIQYSTTQNGTISTTYNVVTLTSNSLVIKNGITSNAYIKINLPAINSTAITTIASDVGDARGIITDKAGNVYFCDGVNNIVRKISITDGKITTIAGTGRKILNREDFKPYEDNIAATSADIYNPSGLAIDAAGNIYISEANIYNGRVDKVSVDGKISLIAGSLKFGLQEVGDGGLAVNALLREPVGLALDNAGNVYIADIQNYRIRKVSATDKKITTVAGNGTNDYISNDNVAAISIPVQPLYLSLDANNNIIFTDMARGSIRKITTSTGIISTIGRNHYDKNTDNNGDGGVISEASVGFPWGLCMAANGDIYFIGDFVSVRKIEKATNIVNTIAGNGYDNYIGDGPHATAYSLNAYQVAVDSKGNVYIAGGSRIRKVVAK